MYCLLDFDKKKSRVEVRCLNLIIIKSRYIEIKVDIDMRKKYNGM